MPLFSISDSLLSSVQQTNFDEEKHLRLLIEKNLQPVFNCRFVASEFSTGSVHSGRIDTLALSEDNNPVIIEYKKVESSAVINQSLFYLAWIHDHRGDFQVAARKSLGSDIEIDWSDVRVICIAPNYRKYDLYAVQVMGVSLELWTYRLFRNETIYLEEVFQKTLVKTADLDQKNSILVGANKKASLKHRIEAYTYEGHTKNKPAHIVELAEDVREFVLQLDTAMEEAPRKQYVAYKISQNIVCMELRRDKLLLYLKLNPTLIEPLPELARDVREVGHYSTGDLELSVSSTEDFEVAKQYIEFAYQNVGG